MAAHQRLVSEEKRLQSAMRAQEFRLDFKRKTGV